MATMKIKKGDMVKVIAGKDKDKEGKVIAVNHKRWKSSGRRRQYADKAHKTKYGESEWWNHSSGRHRSTLLT